MDHAAQSCTTPHKNWPCFRPLILSVFIGISIRQLGYKFWEIDADIYMYQPEGFEQGDLYAKVCTAWNRSMNLESEDSEIFAVYWICAIAGEDCESILGYIFTLTSGAISWSSNKQSTVAVVHRSRIHGKGLAYQFNGKNGLRQIPETLRYHHPETRKQKPQKVGVMEYFELSVAQGICRSWPCEGSSEEGSETNS